MEKLLFAVIALLIYAAAIALSGWIIMLVLNVILEYFDYRSITWLVGCALAFVISVITNIFNRSSK